MLRSPTRQSLCPTSAAECRDLAVSQHEHAGCGTCGPAGQVRATSVATCPATRRLSPRTWKALAVFGRRASWPNRTARRHRDRTDRARRPARADYRQSGRTVRSDQVLLARHHHGRNEHLHGLSPIAVASTWVDMSNVIVWDIETVPDIKGFAVANGRDGKSDDEIRARWGTSSPSTSTTPSSASAPSLFIVKIAAGLSTLLAHRTLGRGPRRH
jgi:hypothetical protein